MDVRKEFVLRACEKDANISELAREYGVSRKTAHKWVERYRTAGVTGLDDMSRAPRVRETCSGEVVARLVEVHREHPRWGPRKLVVVLARSGREEDVISPRTAARLLHRLGLKPGRRRGAAAGPMGSAQLVAPNPRAVEPNDLWTIDFKGAWKTKDGAICEPLTVRDAFSRMLLCVVAMTSRSTSAVREALESVFKIYGIPRAILVDNGTPFICVAARAGLTRLSAWWVSLHIEVHRGRLGSPQDNGAHERMHRDLATEVGSSPATNLARQQVVLDRWRDDFNKTRPHEALGMAVPAKFYKKSSRSYRGPRPTSYAPDSIVRKVSGNGHIHLKNKMARVGAGLVGQTVSLSRIAGGYRLHFYALDLGELADADFQPRRAGTQKVSPHPRSRLSPRTKS